MNPKTNEWMHKETVQGFAHNSAIASGIAHLRNVKIVKHGKYQTNVENIINRYGIDMAESLKLRVV